MAGVLGHITVLDLSRVLAGPWATQLLADLGATVYKIERPGSGDDTRAWGPPFATSEDGKHKASAYYLSTNRGKRSVAIDLAKPEGQQLVRRLAAQCDVVVENFKVGALTRYGLDYERLSSDHPALVYCSITGFGQDGPLADRAGYDLVIQAMGGLMSITGDRDGPPTKVGVAVSDLFTGLYATTAILGALIHRDRTGEGQHIDLALLDCQAAMLANQAMNYLIGGVAPGRLGNAHPNIVPYESFAVADGHIVVAVGNDGQFRAFCGVIDAPALADDPRFATNAVRVANRDALLAMLIPRLATRTRQQWLAALEPAGVPCGPINDLAEVFAEPQLLHRGMRPDLPAPGPAAGLGTLPAVGCPIRFSDAPVGAATQAPALGADTADVLSDLLGLDDDALAALARSGVIALADD